MDAIMYIPPNYPWYYHTYGNYCPCCGRPMSYTTWNPKTPYGPNVACATATGQPQDFQNNKKKDDK